MSLKDYEVRDTWYDRSLPDYLKHLDQTTKDWYLEKRHHMTRDVYIKNNFQYAMLRLLYGNKNGEEEDYTSENYN